MYLASLERTSSLSRLLIHVGLHVMLWHMYTYWCYQFVRYATKYQVTYENRKLPTYYAVWTGRQVCKYAWCGDNVATGTNEIVGTWTCYRLIVGTVLLQYVP